jgi:TrmH family RNA methyltransferase
LTERRRKEIARLSRRRGRDEIGQFLVEGYRSVQSAVNAGAPIVDVVIADGVADVPGLFDFLDEIHATIYRTSDREMGRLSDVTTSQGILAAVALERKEAAGLPEAQRILMMDGLRDPGNVGTLIRTAAWFGIDAVVAGPGTADLYSPKVVRATMGGLWDLQLASTADLADYVHALRAKGYDVRAAHMDGDRAAEWHPQGRSALVLGSEAEGPSPPVLESVHGTITIHSAAKTKGAESLNVSSAGAVIMAGWAATKSI